SPSLTKGPLANPNYVPPANDPRVSRISDALKALSMHSSMALRQGAREASLVLMARQTGANLSNTEPVDMGVKSSREVYQEALVLLQDPLLPVRAQGLAMLRHLVEPPLPTSKTTPIEGALVPAILDIFIHSVQNEDSFIFLNAVQGLTAMVQRFGRDVFKRLLDLYATDPRQSAVGLSKQELDVKLRVGEALGVVIGKCGESLSGYIDLTVPVILAIIRDHHLPIPLRTSAISLASRCVDVAPLAMGVYTAELSGSMLDILELEHVAVVEPKSRSRHKPSQPQYGNQQWARGDGGAIGTENEQQSAGAVHGHLDGEKKVESGTDGDLNRSSRQGVVGVVDGDTGVIPPKRSNNLLPPFQAGDLATDANPTGIDPKLSPLRRAGTILRYLASVDADSVVNAMAGEAVELMAHLYGDACFVPKRTRQWDACRSGWRGVGRLPDMGNNSRYATTCLRLNPALLAK
ncbi:984_t:CDS:2, partial [Acaulospora colombiana]